MSNRLFCAKALRCTVAVLVACGMLGALLIVGARATTGVAWADEEEDIAAGQQVVDGAHVALSDAETRMELLVSEYDALKQEADQLQLQIDETSAQALEAQQAVIQGRTALGKSAIYEYRDGGTTQSLVAVVLGSSDLADLLQNVSYLERIMAYQADEIAAQQQRSNQFQQLIDNLNVQKDAHDKKLVELEAKQAEAQQVVVSASSQLQNAQDDQAARVAALQKAADEMVAAGGVGEPVEVAGANTPERGDVVAPDTPVVENPEPVVPDHGGGSAGGDGNTGNAGGDVGWSTGIASAYGGSTDPNTPNPGITASGAVCDDWSMGVAVPMAWPNYWRYYGRTVEISYGGQTVIATINDCGGMGGGSRSLDLQPGVWKAFGFSSCMEWGLRTVNYRIL